jgi:hypothetical protein
MTPSDGQRRLRERRHRVETKCSAKRCSHVNTQCAVTKPIGYTAIMGDISGYVPGNISVCIVPKAACTFWLRILRYLNGEIKLKRNPLDTSKYETHYTRPHYLNLLSTENEAHVRFIQSSVRVMTSRDPYSRLFSAYIDKFLLPDFWFSKGKEIIKIIRRRKASKKSLKCGHDVTFREFIKYVIHNNGSIATIDQDKHWLPASYLCDPCSFKPTIVAKQETIMADMQVTWAQADLAWVNQLVTHDSHAEYEMADQCHYVFTTHHIYEQCATKRDLARLLWRSFVYNGYIPLDEAYPEELLGRAPTCDIFMYQVLRVRKSWTRTGVQEKRLRRRALVRAYSSISSHDLRRLQTLYRTDFEMFDYESEPEDIFRTASFGHAIPI